MKLELDVDDDIVHGLIRTYPEPEDFAFEVTKIFEDAARNHPFEEAQTSFDFIDGPPTGRPYLVLIPPQLAEALMRIEFPCGTKPESVEDVLLHIANVAVQVFPERQSADVLPFPAPNP